MLFEFDSLSEQKANLKYLGPDAAKPYWSVSTWVVSKSPFSRIVFFSGVSEAFSSIARRSIFDSVDSQDERRSKKLMKGIYL